MKFFDWLKGYFDFCFKAAKWAEAYAISIFRIADPAFNPKPAFGIAEAMRDCLTVMQNIGISGITAAIVHEQILA